MKRDKELSLPSTYFGRVEEQYHYKNRNYSASNCHVGYCKAVNELSRECPEVAAIGRCCFCLTITLTECILTKWWWEAVWSSIVTRFSRQFVSLLLWWVVCEALVGGGWTL